MNRKRLLIAVPVVVVAAVVWSVVRAHTAPIVITGIVTTNEVVISPQIAGQVDSLFIREGDSVARGQLIAVIRPDELRADRAFYSYSADAATGELAGSEAAVRLQQETTAQQIKQAEAALAAAQATRGEASADAENAQRAVTRAEALFKTGAITQQELDEKRTLASMALARMSAAEKQVEAQTAAVALARSNAEQNVIKRSQLTSMRAQRAAADAQRTKADVRLAYTELHAPVSGIVDVRAVRQGEYVTAGQTVASLVNPDDFWVRADIEESYIERVKIGDHLTVRLPSGEERQGTVIFRGVDAGFATQRDVSRRKRDVKTFEIRLRVDNKDRRLALGMTAYVIVPVTG